MSWMRSAFATQVVGKARWVDAGDLIQERYRLLSRLGSGGMAEVWSATDERLERTVAVKFLAPQLSEDPEFLVRFFSEAQAVARISHPNVVQVLDFGEHSGAPYLVMEYVSGGPLTDRTGEPWSVDEASDLIGKAALGAGAAHALGIVHRDIKPGNVLLSEDGSAKLADFGIAASARSERLTATGAAIGSPHYISPEQASGRDATPASDVYSLGILIYELLTGRRPFEGDNITAIAIAHVEQDPVPPRALVPEIGPETDALVLRCLAKDPDARYADGNELAAALEHSEDVSVAVTTTDETDLVLETPWRSRRDVLVGSLLVIALVVLAVTVLARGDQPPAAADDRLDEVGGLDVRRSKSPTAHASSFGSEERPTPTPSASKKKAPVAGTRDRDRDSDPDPQPSEDEPEPTPSGSAPTPEPTSESSEPP